VLDVFGYTPTGNQRGPPSTSFSRAKRLRPSGVRLRSARYARLRSASPQRGEAGWNKDNLQKAKYTGHANPIQMDKSMSGEYCKTSIEGAVNHG
jgi:hypothetical protein